MIKRILNSGVKILDRMGFPIIRQLCFFRYRIKFGSFPNMKNPQTINEKLLWLEFFSDTSKWTELSDKYLVRNYIKEKGLEHILVKSYGAYLDPMEINFSKLPKSFVIKTNNGYGTVLLIKNKDEINKLALKKKLVSWLKEPFGYWTGEPHYTRIKPCVIVEEFLDIDKSISSSLVDYKMWCLNGKVYTCFACANRNIEHHKADFCTYDIKDWRRRADMMSKEFQNDTLLPKPKCLDEMVKYAEILSADFPLVRVDFYEVNGKVYFGEMTFTSNGGRMAYFTDNTLLKMGQALDISNIMNKA